MTIVGRRFTVTVTASSAPSWVASTLVNPLTWYPIGSNVMNDVASWRIWPGGSTAPYATPWSGNAGPLGLFDNWSSACLATRMGTHGAWVNLGGGHNGYYGNDLYAFDLGTAQWSRLTNPFGSAPGEVLSHTVIHPSGRFPDGTALGGTPKIPHLNSAVEYVPERNEVHIAGLQTRFDDHSVTSTPTAFALDQVVPGDFVGNAQRGWRPSGTLLSSGSNPFGASRYVPVSATDPDAGGVVFYQRMNGQPPAWLNPATLTWTIAPAGSTGMLDSVHVNLGYIHSRRALYYMAHQFPAGRKLRVYDLAGWSAGTAASLSAPVDCVTFVPATGLAWPPRGSAGGGLIAEQCSMEWSEALGAFLVSRDTGYVWKLTPPADGSLAGSVGSPWIWEMLPRLGTPPPHGPTQAGAYLGYYDKFRVVRWGAVEVALVCARHDSKMYAMRLSA